MISKRTDHWHYKAVVHVVASSVTLLLDMSHLITGNINDSIIKTMLYIVTNNYVRSLNTSLAVQLMTVMIMMKHCTNKKNKPFKFGKFK